MLSGSLAFKIFPRAGTMPVPVSPILFTLSGHNTYTGCITAEIYSRQCTVGTRVLPRTSRRWGQHSKANIQRHGLGGIALQIAVKHGNIDYCSDAARQVTGARGLRYAVLPPFERRAWMRRRSR